MYLAAKRATLMEKGVLNRGGTNEQIEPEVDKVCYIHFYISTCVTFIGKEKKNTLAPSTEDLLNYVHRNIHRAIKVLGRLIHLQVSNINCYVRL